MAIIFMTKLLSANKRHFFVITRHCQSITGVKKVDDVLVKVTGGRISGWLKVLGQVSGQTEVKHSQEAVLVAEKLFEQKQDERQKQTRVLKDLQKLLKHATEERELKTSIRGTAEYMKIVEKENNLYGQVDELQEQITVLEEAERKFFIKFSSSIRSSQAIERTQSQRSQQFGYVLSVVGICLGGIISFILNEHRMNKVYKIVSSATDLANDYKGDMGNLGEQFQQQQDKMEELISSIQSKLGHSSVHTELTNKSQKQRVSMEKCLEEILQKVKDQKILLDRIDREITDLKKLHESEIVRDSSGGVVHVSPEVKDILSNNQKQMEWKMKVTTVVSLILTVPIIYIFNKGIGGS
ncbi:uncharacterized protein LOC110453212 [Mizuhopecten yessoensis]|uniref:Coiled-coil domain-containing protein 51 n=1 Tax=Mizuhopecten yessoensis TaxID=6573 RepID=A0A210QHY1_MIZYE|nr:uncharacterized protein LOC110453212 [Mizuhopecten yessoensis]OWF48309.1 Coiled-coil domain-containing protein 51 [Mizuhopecten yessoensis]